MQTLHSTRMKLWLHFGHVLSFLCGSLGSALASRHPAGSQSPGQSQQEHATSQSWDRPGPPGNRGHRCQRISGWVQKTNQITTTTLEIKTITMFAKSRNLFRFCSVVSLKKGHKILTTSINRKWVSWSAFKRWGLCWGLKMKHRTSSLRGQHQWLPLISCITSQSNEQGNVFRATQSKKSTEE